MTLPIGEPTAALEGSRCVLLIVGGLGKGLGLRTDALPIDVGIGGSGRLLTELSRGSQGKG